MKRKTKKIDVDEAVKIKGELGTTRKTIMKRVANKEDKWFCDLWKGIVFGYREQKGGGKKLMARLPSGKYVFPDKSENKKSIKPDTPYICLIYEPLDDDGNKANAAFARIICEEYMPKITVTPKGIVWMVWKNDKGETEKRMTVQKSKNYRIAEAYNRFEEMGYEEIRIICVKNKNKNNDVPNLDS